jgi:uncharacterized membrane protein YeaQ/YmgE (transglycosylase-associated protein family)
MTLEAIGIWILVGGIAGLLAEWFVGGVGAGCIGTVIVGIIGGMLGGWLFDLMNISLGRGFVDNVITAFVGAVVVLIVLNLLRRL